MPLSLSFFLRCSRAASSVEVNGSIAYASQQPWIMNVTLRENILFGHAFDVERYKRTLAACQLLPDLAQFPAGT